MAIEAGDFKTGLTVIVDGDPWVVLDFMHVKPGKGAAILKTKMKNLKTGSTQERNFNASTKFEQANIERKQAQYSYFIVMIIFQDIRNRRDVRRILPCSPSRKATDIGARFVSDILRDGTASLQTACCPDFGHLSPSFFMFCC